MVKKALIAVTSCQKFATLEKPTGLWLGQAVHFYDELIKQGWTIDFVSPKGGYTPLDPMSLQQGMDEVCWKYYSDPAFRQLLANTKKPSEVNPEEYDVIHFAGGHGTVWDFYEDEKLHQVARKIYEKGGVVAAVCHGPVALCNLKLSNDEYLVKGKKLTCFSDQEEKAVELDKHVPYMLQTTLVQRGGIYSQEGNWQPHVVVDDRLITGQNPASTRGVGKAVLEHKW